MKKEYCAQHADDPVECQACLGHDAQKWTQLLPAPGWHACYLQGDGEIFVEPLAFWALRDDSGVVAVSVDASGFADTVDTASNFVCLLRPGQIAPDPAMVDDAARRIARSKAPTGATSGAPEKPGQSDEEEKP